jgi:acyl-coenzyme A synthetase/AMP-(fatty) acid ligase
VPTIEIQTSGTTGPPKRFPVTYDKAYRHFVERLATPDALAGKPLTLPALLFMSMGNLSGMMGTLPALLLGQRMLLHDRFNLDAWRNYVRTYRPASSGLPPSSVQMLLDLETPVEELASLRSLMVGSAPIDPKVHRAFEARYGVPLLLAYGATEFYGTVAAMTLELYDEWRDRKFGSVGRAIPGVTLRTVNPDNGAVCPPGETGLIEVFSEDIAPNWLRTSDLAMIDEDGFVFIHGRADGAIIRGGFKLLPEVIERALLLHDDVATVAVVGVPDRRLGQVPAAAFACVPGQEPQDPKRLEAHLRKHLPATHIPVHWRLVEELPRTTSMKVDRLAVAQLFKHSLSA